MILVNGTAGDAVSALDRGLGYGDGVFRTFLLRGGKPVLWRRHYAKLASDCNALGIACPAADILTRDVETLAAGEPDSVVKIIVTRGSAPRGYAFSRTIAPTRIVSSSPMPAYPHEYYDRGVRVHRCRLRLAAQPALAGVKHLNRLEQVLARAEWNDPAIAEGVLCDADDKIIGGVMSNLFLVRDGVLVTPDLKRCGVAGVTRALVLELARENGLAARIDEICIDDLLAAEAVLLVNSVIGVWQVAALDRKTWRRSIFSDQIGKWLEGARDD